MLEGIFSMKERGHMVSSAASEVSCVLEIAAMVRP